mgnify:FL=1
MQVKSDTRRLSNQTAINAVIRHVIGDCRNGLVGAVKLYVAPVIAERLALNEDGADILRNELGVDPEIIADPMLSEDAYRLEKKT